MLIFSPILLGMVIQVYIPGSHSNTLTTPIADPEICQHLSTDTCKEDSVRTQCPYMCNPVNTTGIDPEICQHLSTDTCMEDVVRTTCPYKCNPVNTPALGCPTGYTGINGSEDIYEYLNIPCLNGGTCISGTANYTCVCQGGFEGIHCDIKNDAQLGTNPTIQGTNITADSTLLGVCPGDNGLFQENSGNCFHFSSDANNEQTANWTQARENCKALGIIVGRNADLAELNNQHNGGSDGWLMEMITAKEKEIWLGASDLHHNGYWFWAHSGHRLSKEHHFWGPNQPDNEGKENCLSTQPQGNRNPKRQYLDDYSCQYDKHYVCQLFKGTLYQDIGEI